MIQIYSSSSELKEQTASKSYLCSTEDLGGDDDYVMEGESRPENDTYSYSTEIPDDENLDEEVTETFDKTPEFPREKTPEDEIKLSDVGPVASWTRWVLLNLLKSIVIFALCLHTAGMINKIYDDDRQLIVPKFTLESVSVFPIQLHPAGSNSTVRNITAGWNMIFNVGNPSGNHVLSFSDIAAEVYYGKNPLHHVLPLLPVLNKVTPPWMTAKSIWKTVVPGFNQPQAPHQDLVKVTFDSNIPVSIDNATASSLVEDINSGMSWGFSVRLHGNITQSQKNPEKDLNRDSSTGSFTAQCPLNMAFLQKTGGVMASSSSDCKVLRSGLDSWMVLAISIAVVHATLRTCFYLSSKCWGKRARFEC